MHISYRHDNPEWIVNETEAETIFAALHEIYPAKRRALEALRANLSPALIKRTEDEIALIEHMISVLENE